MSNFNTPRHGVHRLSIREMSDLHGTALLIGAEATAEMLQRQITGFHQRGADIRRPVNMGVDLSSRPDMHAEVLVGGPGEAPRLIKA